MNSVYNGLESYAMFDTMFCRSVGSVKAITTRHPSHRWLNSLTYYLQNKVFIKPFAVNNDHQVIVKRDFHSFLKPKLFTDKHLKTWTQMSTNLLFTSLTTDS